MLLMLRNQVRMFPAVWKHLGVSSVFQTPVQNVAPQKAGAVVYGGGEDRPFSKATGTFLAPTLCGSVMDALAFAPHLHTIKPKQHVQQSPCHIHISW